jgi:hypothetical protein
MYSATQIRENECALVDFKLEDTEAMFVVYSNHTHTPCSVVFYALKASSSCSFQKRETLFCFVGEYAVQRKPEEKTLGVGSIAERRSLLGGIRGTRV